MILPMVVSLVELVRLLLARVNVEATDSMSSGGPSCSKSSSSSSWLLTGKRWKVLPSHRITAMNIMVCIKVWKYSKGRQKGKEGWYFFETVWNNIYKMHTSFKWRPQSSPTPREDTKVPNPPPYSHVWPTGNLCVPFLHDRGLQSVCEFDFYCL